MKGSPQLSSASHEQKNPLAQHLLQGVFRLGMREKKGDLPGSIKEAVLLGQSGSAFETRY